jgi:hypothetical protein
MNDIAIREMSLEDAMRNQYVCIGMGTVIRNPTFGLYIVAQVRTSELCAICIEPHRDVNRYKDPVWVQSPWNMTEDEIHSLLGGRDDKWTVLLGKDNDIEQLRLRCRVD